MTGGKPRVLLVEDDRHIRVTLGEYLSAKGYAVTQAGNGVEALDAWARTNPSVVVLDVLLPLLDGFGVLRQARGRAEMRKAAVIMITAAYKTESHRQEALRRFGAVRAAALDPSLRGRIFGLGLECHRRGWVPGRLMGALAPRYFERLLAS